MASPASSSRAATRPRWLPPSSQLLRDPERRARMGAAAAARAATMFDEERVVASLLEAYESLATRPA